MAVAGEGATSETGILQEVKSKLGQRGQRRAFVCCASRGVECLIHSTFEVSNARAMAAFSSDAEPTFCHSPPQTSEYLLARNMITVRVLCDDGVLSLEICSTWGKVPVFNVWCQAQITTQVACDASKERKETLFI